MARIRDPYLTAASAAFMLLGVGYLLREGGPFSPAVMLVLGVLPNFAGCLAVPLIAAPLLRRRLRGVWSTNRVSALIGAVLGLAGAAAIEVLHVMFDLGAYDSNDMIASLAGAALGVATLLAIDRVFSADRPSPEVVRGEA